ncbi:MAG: SDR family NAD(P)-dependent oxidoreductase [Aquabacterium sp.]|nr:SDR family NAD(P)-dependent oxidoreductase [Aquabacterium sp.]
MTSTADRTFSLQGKTVAVTGASGMIGVYICRSLLKAGAHVVGVVRNPAKAAFLATEGVEFRTADLNDPEALTLAFKGCDAVVSNAAMYVAMKFLMATADHKKANVDGTRHVYESAHRAGVKRIVHISTFGVYKWWPLRTINETTPQINGERKQGGPYRATKQISEAMAWQFSASLGLDVTTLRPTAVFGARDFNLLRTLYKFLKLPVLPLPSISLPFVYAGDVADAVTGALRNDASIGHAYNVGGTMHQFSDVMKALVTACGRGPRVLALPLPVGLRVDNTKAERDIGFYSRPLSQAMAEIMAEDAPVFSA